MSPRRQSWFVRGLALFAVLRVATLAAVLPMFAHLDEIEHYDLVLRYAHGDWPAQDDDAYSAEAARLGAWYQSGLWREPLGPGPYAHFLPGLVLNDALLARHPEFQERLALDPSRRAQVAAYAAERVRATRDSAPNYQAFQPPAYYLAGAAWWHAGRALGLDGPGLLLWTRWLGALFAGAAVLATFALARRACRGGPPALALATAALVALAPQDVMACVNNDVPGVLLGPVAWLGAAAVGAAAARGTPRGAAFQLGAGLLVALIGLTKPTGLPGVLAAAVILLPGARAAWRDHGGRGLRRGCAPFAVGLALPLLAWFGYALVQFGELTGARHKNALMGFAPQTLANLADHPITTAGGWWLFVTDTVTRAWRGELQWHGEVLRHGWADAVYLTLTLGGLALAAWASWRRAAALPRPPFRAGAWVAVVTAVLLLLAISIGWDFSDAHWPTPDYPWFTNARLVFVAFPALALLLVGGFASVLRLPGLVLAVGLLAVTCLGSELWLHRALLGNPHAVFRLAGW